MAANDCERNHERTIYARQVRGESFGHSIHEVLLLRIAAEVAEGSTTMERREGESGLSFALSACAAALHPSRATAYRLKSEAELSQPKV
jgi:hypothetical protein